VKIILFLFVWLVVLPWWAIAQESVAVNINKTSIQWTYSEDINEVDLWELGCGGTAGAYLENIVSFDVSVMQTPLKDAVPGPGLWFCAMRGVNEFGPGGWSTTTLNFITGSPPAGEVTPSIAVE